MPAKLPRLSGCLIRLIAAPAIWLAGALAPARAADVVKVAQVNQDASELLGPEGIAIGHHYIFAIGQDGFIFRIPIRGGKTEKIGDLGELLGIDYPEGKKGKDRRFQIAGLLLADAETLFVAVTKIGDGAVVRVQLQDDKPRRAEIVACGLKHPNGFAFSSKQKALYVSDEGGLFGIKATPVYRITFQNGNYRTGPKTTCEAVVRCAMPNGLALSPDDRFLYVAQTGRLLTLLPGAILRFDLENPKAPPARHPFGGWPDGLLITPDGRHLLLVTQSNSQVHWIDASTLNPLRSGRLQAPAKKVHPASPALADGRIYLTSFWNLSPATALKLINLDASLYDHEIYQFPVAQFPP